jgi:pimeloyl-ACP methyl ester carboxylesterase
VLAGEQFILGDEYDMPSTRVNDVNLYYEIHGNGPALMLVAGLASDSQSWQPIIQDLSQHFCVIILDNRGTGRTTPHEVETSIQQMSDDCMALLRELGVQSVALLGHSMGGFVALDCALRYPHHVSHLILAGTSAVNSARNTALLRDWVSYLETGMDVEHWFRNLFYWIFSPRFFEDQGAVNEAVRFAVEYPYPQSRIAFANQVKAIETFDCVEELPDIRMKTLILCGNADLFFPPEESLKVLQAIPGSTCSLIKDAAHSIHMEQPKAFTEYVVNFLSHGSPVTPADIVPGGTTSL